MSLGRRDGCNRKSARLIVSEREALLSYPPREFNGPMSLDRQLSVLIHSPVLNIHQTSAVFLANGLYFARNKQQIANWVVSTNAGV